MTLSKVIEALLIVQPYFNEDGYHIGTDHDKIFIYKTDIPMTIEDAKRLVDLGFRQDKDGIRAGDKDGEYEGEYNPNSDWAAFV